MKSILFCLLIMFPAPLLAQSHSDVESLCAQALAYAKASAAKMPGDYVFRVSRPPLMPPLKPGRLTFDPERLSKQDPVGRFFAVFRVNVEGIASASVRVEMEGKWIGTLYQAKGALKRKTTITEDDFEEITFEGIPPAGAIKVFPHGSRLCQPMQAGKIMTNMQVETIPMVSALDKVRVTLCNGPLQIVGEATAKSSGGKGEKVRLEMAGSRKILMATVTGPGQAMVEAKGGTASL
ncbi:MAG: flagellar basal body P-ring formation chaperone FlgA [Holophagales bacterium]|jgi:flagella basal body P-ring formation protein FlgA|nr:flagellar basal body P-ring formation chaperone FlgA [Holophagales bacterium]